MKEKWKEKDNPLFQKIENEYIFETFNFPNTQPLLTTML